MNSAKTELLKPHHDGFMVYRRRTTMKALLFAVLMLVGTAYAAPYIGVAADVNHGNTQAVIGVSSLIGPLGIEGTHSTNYILPTKLTTCGYNKSESKTCTTNETDGIRNTVSATATMHFTDKLSGVAKVGAGNVSKSYFGSLGVSYEAKPRLHLNADVVASQRSGDRIYRPTIGANFSF